jgi:uncharacterized protein YjiS (DUF1127 family)
MSMMSLNVAVVRLRRRPRWSHVRSILIQWRDRVRSRYELMSLGDRELWDVGLTRVDADNEASKPFWRS